MFYDVLWYSLMFYDNLWCSMMFYDVLCFSTLFYDFPWFKIILGFLLSEHTSGVSPVICVLFIIMPVQSRRWLTAQRRRRLLFPACISTLVIPIIVLIMILIIMIMIMVMLMPIMLNMMLIVMMMWMKMEEHLHSRALPRFKARFQALHWFGWKCDHIFIYCNCERV